MCLAVPGRITAIDGRTATVDFGGVQRSADLSLVEAAIGDYIIVHAGFAITRLDKEEAARSLALWDEVLSRHGDLDDIV